MGLELAVIVPVLRRPERVKPFLASLEANTPEPHRVLFLADSDDLEELKALDKAKADYIALSPPAPWPKKINVGYAVTKEPFVFLAADDLRFHPDWYEAARELMEPGVGVVGTNDLANPRVIAGRHATHMLVARDYIEEFGVIDEPGKVVHEGYFLDYADDELIQTAESRGAYRHAHRSIVEHLHPIVGDRPGKLADDDTYRRGRAQVRNGRNVYRRRMKLWMHP